MNSRPGSGRSPTVAVAAGTTAVVTGRATGSRVTGTATGSRVTGTATDTATEPEARATLLARSGRWRGPLGTPCIAGTGPAPASRSRYRSSWAAIFLLISYWACLSTAAAVAATSISLDGPPRSMPTAIHAPPPEAETGLDLDAGVLLIDTRIPVFVDGHWQIMSDQEHGELRRRAAATPKETPSATAHVATTTEVVIDTSTVTDAADPATTTAVIVAADLPKPFDGALAANFSAGHTCPAFITEFLSNATFQACYPISLLLQGSQSFFEAEKSFVKITQVLDVACQADVDMCTDYFNNLAKTLISDDNCGEEYDLENALVVQAYRGMKTYSTVYRATCLTDRDLDPPRYCFANAITNGTTASNAYLYYLPFNSTLPDTAAPACGSCTRQTMEIYQAATSNRKAEIVHTYPGAAEQINVECGNSFVNTSLAAVVESSATSPLYPTSPPSLLLFSLLLMTISQWIL